MPLSPEIITRTDPSWLSDAGAASGCPTPGPQGQSGRAGVAEQGERPSGTPGNLGDPIVSADNAGWRTGLPSSGMIRGLAFGAVGDEERTQRRYRRAKATKLGARGDGESERFVVPSNRGNDPERTPGREGDAVS